MRWVQSPFSRVKMYEQDEQENGMGQMAQTSGHGRHWPLLSKVVRGHRRHPPGPFNSHSCWAFSRDFSGEDGWTHRLLMRSNEASQK